MSLFKNPLKPDDHPIPDSGLEDSLSDKDVYIGCLAWVFIVWIIAVLGYNVLLFFLSFLT